MTSDSEKAQGRPGCYTCVDYRREMILVGLRNKLAGKNLTDAERAAIERAVSDLEKEIGLD